MQALDAERERASERFPSSTLAQPLERFRHRLIRTVGR